MGFIELRHEPGVYTRVTAVMSNRNSSLFIEATARKPGLLLNQGISGSIPLEAENTESLSHTYF